MQNFLTTIGFGDFRAETMEQKIFFIVICVPGHTLTTAMLTQLADQAMGLLHSGRRVGRNSKRRMKVPSFVLSLSLSLHSIFPFCSLRDHLSLSLSPSPCLCLSLFSLSRAPLSHSLTFFTFASPHLSLSRTTRSIEPRNLLPRHRSTRSVLEPAVRSP